VHGVFGGQIRDRGLRRPGTPSPHLHRNLGLAATPPASNSSGLSRAAKCCLPTCTGQSP
jgi:hypothetical protein